MCRWVGTLLSDGTREQAVRAWFLPQNHPRVPSTLSFHEIKNETAEVDSSTQLLCESSLIPKWPTLSCAAFTCHADSPSPQTTTIRVRNATISRRGTREIETQFTSNRPRLPCALCEREAESCTA